MINFDKFWKVGMGRSDQELQQHYREVRIESEVHQNIGEVRIQLEVQQQQHLGGDLWVGGDSISYWRSLGDSGPDAFGGMQRVPILGGLLFCSGCRGWGRMLPASG